MAFLIVLGPDAETMAHLEVLGPKWDIRLSFGLASMMLVGGAQQECQPCKDASGGQLGTTSCGRQDEQLLAEMVILSKNAGQT
eukprot:601247-Pelagomonas_calceolata.AAC.3